MTAYSPTSHAAYLGYLMRHVYFRMLFGAFAFLTFFGVMPKAPTRAPFEGAVAYLAHTVGTSLIGFAALAVILSLVCAIWAGVAAARGLIPPAQPVPDQAADGRAL